MLGFFGKKTPQPKNDFTIVAGNPNPKSITFEGTLPQNLLNFSRFSLRRNDENSLRVSPLFTELCDKSKSIIQMDMARISESRMQLSILRTLMSWQDAERTSLISYLNGNDCPDMLDTQLAVKLLPQLPAVNEERFLIQLARDVLAMDDVRETLTKDGGDLILIDAPYNGDTGEFSIDVVLNGSCSGCSSAIPNTLANLGLRVEQFLSDRKEHELYQNNTIVQGMTFKGFKPVEIKGGFYSPK
jgi:Fe-S cluster biogenesis protein NfuA